MQGEGSSANVYVLLPSEAAAAVLLIYVALYESFFFFRNAFLFFFLRRRQRRRRRVSASRQRNATAQHKTTTPQPIPVGGSSLVPRSHRVNSEDSVFSSNETHTRRGGPIHFLLVLLACFRLFSPFFSRHPLRVCEREKRDRAVVQYQW